MNVGTKVSLYFKATGLADMDTFSKSDPYIILYRCEGGRSTAIGRTETIMNNLNPAFQKCIDVDYFFETKQEYVVKIYDYDGNKRDEDNDRLGEVPFTLAHIMCSKGHMKTFQIPAPSKGTVTITAVDHARTGEDTIALQFYGRSMRKMDFMSDSDPYFKLSRLLPNGQTQLIYQSETIDNDLNPNWKPLPILKVHSLMGSDSSEKTLLFECFDEDVFGFKGMGCVKLSVDDLVAAAADQNKSFELRKDNKKENLYGLVHLKKCEIIRAVTFADLLKLGWQINMTAAVDFTASNGDPKDPRSLHHFSGGPNEYMRALTSVGEILLDYDSDKNIAAYGFGAMMPDGQVSHFFHLNLEPNPYVRGMEGLIMAYQRSLSVVRLYGPTNFAPTIAAVTTGARQAESDRIYTILLIVTDGEITDMDETIDALVQADDAALSIIIVGVGRDCDFNAMTQLDGDDGALVSRGRKSRRDLVQFVPLREFAGKPQAQLAAEVLREVPAQVERWATIKGLDKKKLFPPGDLSPPLTVKV